MKSHPTFAVDQMACTLGVSRSGYYDYLKRGQSIRDHDNKKLMDAMKIIFKDSHQTYGGPRIHATLKDQGFTCSRPRVARLMKAHGLVAKMSRRVKRATKRSDKNRQPDLVQQNFQVSAPNRVGVGDITYIWVKGRWVYLAVVLDLFSRKIVGMALEETMKSDLVRQAIIQALISRRPPSGLIHHSDLGSQYTSHDIQSLAKSQGIRLSYGSSAYDNVVIESFFHTLKTEHVYFKTYQTLEEAKLDIFTYIFAFYNSKRRHSTLGYQTPNQREDKYNNRNLISVGAFN